MEPKRTKIITDCSWNPAQLQEWKNKYAGDVILGKKSNAELEEFLCHTYSMRKEPLSKLDPYYLNEYLPNAVEVKDTEFKLFAIERNSASEKYYQLEGDGIDIWVLIGNKGHLSSNSSLLYCNLIQYRGLSSQDYENETEECFLYFANLNSLYLQGGR